MKLNELDRLNTVNWIAAHGHAIQNCPMVILFYIFLIRILITIAHLTFSYVSRDVKSDIFIHHVLNRTQSLRPRF